MANENLPAKVAMTPSQHLKPLLDKMQVQLEAALASRLTLGQFQSMALAAYSKNGKLWDCTDESVLRCMLDVAVIGLEPDTVRGHAYLIPYKDTCTLQIGYKGLVHIATRNGDALKIDAHVVYLNDEFSIEYGMKEELRHRPFIPKSKKEDRGPKIGAYSFVKLKSGESTFLYMNMTELDEVRAKANQSSPAWKDFEDEMYKKTVFRRHSKLLPLSEETLTAIEKDIEYENNSKLDPKKEIKVEPSRLFTKVEEETHTPAPTSAVAAEPPPVVKKAKPDPEKEVKQAEKPAEFPAPVINVIAAFKKLGVTQQILEIYMRAPAKAWTTVTVEDLKDCGKKLKASGEEGIKEWLKQFEKDLKTEEEVKELFGETGKPDKVTFGED